MFSILLVNHAKLFVVVVLVASLKDRPSLIAVSTRVDVAFHCGPSKCHIEPSRAVLLTFVSVRLVFVVAMYLR